MYRSTGLSQTQVKGIVKLMLDAQAPVAQEPKQPAPPTRPCLGSFDLMEPT